MSCVQCLITLPGRLVRAHLQNLEENATGAQEFGGRGGPWQYLAVGIRWLQMSYVEIPLLIPLLLLVSVGEYTILPTFLGT